MEKLVCIADFEHEALQRLDQNALDYYRSGADEEVTLAENRRAFKRWIIRPRMLRDVSTRNLTTTVLGRPVAFPIGISPTAMQKLCHADGETANARAAAAMGTIYILSTIATSSIEEIARAAPNGRRWFQLYVYKQRDVTAKLVRRAEAAGFEALVLTVDAPFFGKRRADAKNKFHLPKHLKMANFDIPELAEGVESSKSSGGSGINAYMAKMLDQSLTWKDVAWLRKLTKLPIVLKGILTAEDARLAVEAGVAAVFVSNHGGRQIDTAPATIDVLEEIVEAVRGRCEVYLDGGVTGGTDIFKALALGARMVFAGRPFLWGLTVGGEAGSKRVLEILRDELDLGMSLAGVAGIGEIGRNYVARSSSL